MESNALGAATIATEAIDIVPTSLPQCNVFAFASTDETCPRYVAIHFREYWFTSPSLRLCTLLDLRSYNLSALSTDSADEAGLGDRFFQFLVGVTYAIDTGGEILFWGLACCTS